VLDLKNRITPHYFGVSKCRSARSPRAEPIENGQTSISLSTEGRSRGSKGPAKLIGCPLSKVTGLLSFIVFNNLLVSICLEGRILGAGRAIFFLRHFSLRHGSANPGDFLTLHPGMLILLTQIEIAGYFPDIRISFGDGERPHTWKIRRLTLIRRSNQCSFAFPRRPMRGAIRPR